jgi:hypothetical protein
MTVDRFKPDPFSAQSIWSRLVSLDPPNWIAINSPPTALTAVEENPHPSAVQPPIARPETILSWLSHQWIADSSRKITAAELHKEWCKIGGDVPWALFKRHLRNVPRALPHPKTREVTKVSCFGIRSRS